MYFPCFFILYMYVCVRKLSWAAKNDAADYDVATTMTFFLCCCVFYLFVCLNCAYIFHTTTADVDKVCYFLFNILFCHKINVPHLFIFLSFFNLNCYSLYLSVDFSMSFTLVFFFIYFFVNVYCCFFCFVFCWKMIKNKFSGKFFLSF